MDVKRTRAQQQSVVVLQLINGQIPNVSLANLYQNQKTVFTLHLVFRGREIEKLLNVNKSSVHIDAVLP